MTHLIDTDAMARIIQQQDRRLISEYEREIEHYTGMLRRIKNYHLKYNINYEHREKMEQLRREGHTEDEIWSILSADYHELFRKLKNRQEAVAHLRANIAKIPKM